jgi:acetamidase/formamidase
MDDKDLVEGTTSYFPVFVEGGLFSIGDPHVAQGDGEVSGTAIEGPLRAVYEIRVVKEGRDIPSPQYENDHSYSVTGYGVTIDDAAKMAIRAMIDYIVDQTGLSRTEAYVLASLSADLKIAETVDVPHMLVAMTISKDVF